MKTRTAGRVLHIVARVALRAARPLAAKRIVDAAARWLGPRTSLDEARRLAHSLEGEGTCLSRALTIAALLPGSDVVIGVDPKAREPLFAHAWIEYAGRPLRSSDIGGLEIARLASDSSHVGGRMSPRRAS